MSQMATRGGHMGIGSKGASPGRLVTGRDWQGRENTGSALVLPRLFPPAFHPQPAPQGAKPGPEEGGWAVPRSRGGMLDSLSACLCDFKSKTFCFHPSPCQHLAPCSGPGCHVSAMSVPCQYHVNVVSVPPSPGHRRAGHAWNPAWLCWDCSQQEVRNTTISSGPS